MEKLSLSAAWMYRFTLYLMVPLLFVMQILSWAKINRNMIWVQYSQMTSSSLEHDASTLPFFGKFLFFCLENVSTVLLLVVIWYFLHILRLYQQGQVFSKPIVEKMQKINVVVLAWTLYRILFDTFASIMISLFKPVGHRYIIASFTFDDLVHIFWVLVIFMVVQLMQEAYKIKSEQDLVV